MIPKIIHYCWISNDPYPPKIQKCIDSWKKFLPDYEFRLWNAHSFDVTSSLWVQQAIEVKKYAFAADYIRLYALYNYGGIYLDSDIEVLKSFDDLLSYPYFACTEGNNIIEAGAFGAATKQAWIKECLDYFHDKPFIKSDGTLNMLTLPQVMMKQIMKHYQPLVVDMNGFKNNVNKFETEKIFYMLPKEYFCAKDMGTGILLNTNETYCIHHFAMSWIPKKHKFLPNAKRLLIKIFGVKIIYGIINFLQKIIDFIRHV